LTPDQRGSGGSVVDVDTLTGAPRPFIAGCPVEFEARWSKIPFSHPPLPAEFDGACADKTKKVAYLAPSQLPDVGAAARPAPPPQPAVAVTTNAQKVIVELAQSYIGKATLTLGSKKHFTEEAPLFVRAVLKQAGHDPFEGQLRGKKRWNTKPTDLRRRRVRSLSGRPLVSLPNRKTLPEVGRSTPPRR
jgi:hypothetical protein